MVDMECGLIVWPIMNFILFCFILFLKHKNKTLGPPSQAHWQRAGRSLKCTPQGLNPGPFPSSLFFFFFFFLRSQGLRKGFE
jgi:hypothetical protein